MHDVLAGGLVDHVVSALHLVYREHVLIPGLVLHQVRLGYVEAGVILYEPQCRSLLLGLPVHVIRQALHGSAYAFQVERYEVCEVVTVGFSVLVRTAVLALGLLDHRGDGGVIEEPVAVLQTVPVEEGPGQSPVPVHERMDVPDHVVQYHGLDDRMHVRTVFIVGEGAQLVDESRYELVAWRPVVDLLLVQRVAHHDVVAVPETALPFGTVSDGAGGYGPMHVEDELGREVEVDAPLYSVHGPVVVQDHDLARRLGFASGQYHLLRDLPGGRGALYLAGCDGLLHEGVGQVSLRFPLPGQSGLDAPCRITIDVMEELRETRCHAV